MQISHSTRRPLATARDLAAYHARRERFYTAAALLLGGALDEALMASVRFILQHDAESGATLSAALAGATAVSVSDELDRRRAGAAPIELRCQQRSSPTRDQATATTGLASSASVTHDLRLLAALADQTANALESGDLATAAELSDLQARFVRQHAAACVSELAASLAGGAGRLCAGLGRALAEQIAEDVRLLAIPEMVL